MQATATQPQPLLSPVLRAVAVLPVALVLGAAISIATSASHQAVDHVAAQLAEAPRHVQLAPVLVMARRDASATAAGCTRPEAG